MLLLTLLLLIMSAVAAYALFTKQRTVPSNAFSTVADWDRTSVAVVLVSRNSLMSLMERSERRGTARPARLRRPGQFLVD